MLAIVLTNVNWIFIYCGKKYRFVHVALFKMLPIKQSRKIPYYKYLEWNYWILIGPINRNSYINTFQENPWHELGGPG